MDSLINLPFNPNSPTNLHLDINSCFATIEQQANPKLRGKPIAVAAYNSPTGCIIAPSIEAKKLGIKVGMRVKEGRTLYKDLIVLNPDPMKYRSVHLALKKILLDYTDKCFPKSIDEFSLDFRGTPSLKRGLLENAKEIKKRIRAEVGDWITVSVGIAPNRYLAKVAAGMHKPDGLDLIDKTNYLKVYSKLSLMDLYGIKKGNTNRLNGAGIFTVLGFYNASHTQLKAAFRSISSFYWPARLRGYEIDENNWGRRSFGNSVVLKKYLAQDDILFSILQKLIEKTGVRLRKDGFCAKGVQVALLFKDWDFWKASGQAANYIFDSRDIYKIAANILRQAPNKPVVKIAESVFNLSRVDNLQLALFEDLNKKLSLVNSIDQINERWGNFTLIPAHIMMVRDFAPDSIAFGGIKEIPRMILDNTEDIF